MGNSTFVTEHVKGHGNLGNFYYLKKKEIKMGDTPSVLYMLNGDPANPEGESWGGSYLKNGHSSSYWTDNPSPDLIIDGKKGARTVSKWRTEFLNDWSERMAWL
jgi:hypothetical protein